MNMKPIGTKVILGAMKEQKRTSGLVIPETIADTRGMAIVLAIGDEVALPIKVGDVVLRDPMTPVALMKWKGEDVILLEEEGLLGIAEI